jgi:hypothetical protein
MDPWLSGHTWVIDERGKYHLVPDGRDATLCNRRVIDWQEDGSAVPLLHVDPDLNTGVNPPAEVTCARCAGARDAMLASEH